VTVTDPLVAEIRSRGHWEATIRPVAHQPDRVPYEDLEAVLARSRVSLRGWDVPHLNTREPIMRGQQHIDQSTRFQHHMERWRFTQSGQFFHLNGLSEDWRDQSGLHPPGSASWRPGERLGVTDALWTLTEYFELASRLALTPAGDDEMFISLTLHGLRNRALFVDDPNRVPFHEDYVASVDSFPILRTVDRTVLAAEAWPLALESGRELFLRFGWHPDASVLKSAQDGLRRDPQRQSARLTRTTKGNKPQQPADGDRR
jgi:hypothetical protein